MLGNPGTIKQKEAIAALQSAMKSGDEEAVKQAWQQFHDSVVETVRTDFEMASGDERVLAQRGYRQLTAKEKDFYQKLIKSGKAPNQNRNLQTC